VQKDRHRVTGGLGHNATGSLQLLERCDGDEVAISDLGFWISDLF